MTIREHVPHGAPCWVDLMSTDVDGATAFYSALLGWTPGASNPEFGGYSTFTLGGEAVAGLMGCMDPNGPQNVWSVYLAVTDAAATVEAAKAHGGTVIVEAMPVGDIGTMAVVLDAGHAAVAMWQPATHRGGLVAADGAPCHFELHTRDFDAAVAFYRDVFKWSPQTAADEPGFRYTMLDVGPGENAGIFDAATDLPEGLPAHWAVYFAVPDVDKALAETERLGGSIMMPGVDTPYGRLATAVDPYGAVFKLRSE